MKPVAGLWIDHRRAILVIISDRGEDTLEIKSNAEKQIRREAGSRPGGPFEPHLVPADDRRQREYTTELDRYYDRVAAHIRGAAAILIFGPGEAKGEIQKRIEQHPTGTRILAVEKADKMTVRQIVARVRQRFSRIER